MSNELLSVGGLTLERLRNFVAIAEAGSIAKVAKGDPGRMALLSRQLKELETFFGAPLRRREGKNMILSEAGKRLARIAHEQLVALDDFKRGCLSLPVELTIAAGNSVLEWLVLPRMGEVLAAFPAARFQLLSQRTADVEADLGAGKVDLGLVRADALRPGLRGISLPGCEISYALFVPKRLAAGLKPLNLKKKVPELPLATSAGGQFRSHLEDEANRAGWQLRVSVSCSSFTQAAQAVSAGSCAAILPSIAAVQFGKDAVQSFDLPFLRGYTRRLVLAYDSRHSETREIVRPAAMKLAAILSPGRTRGAIE